MRWTLAIKHKIIQLFRKPTCRYCTLTCTPQYGETCEVCEEDFFYDPRTKRSAR